MLISRAEASWAALVPFQVFEKYCVIGKISQRLYLSKVQQGFCADLKGRGFLGRMDDHGEPRESVCLGQTCDRSDVPGRGH